MSDVLNSDCFPVSKFMPTLCPCVINCKVAHTAILDSLPWLLEHGVFATHTDTPPQHTSLLSVSPLQQYEDTWRYSTQSTESFRSELLIGTSKSAHPRAGHQAHMRDYCRLEDRNLCSSLWISAGDFFLNFKSFK